MVSWTVQMPFQPAGNSTTVPGTISITSPILVGVGGAARDEMAEFVARNLQRPGARRALPEADFGLAVRPLVQQHAIVLGIAGDRVRLVAPVLERPGVGGRAFEMRRRRVEFRRHQASFRRVRPSMTLAALVGPVLGAHRLRGLLQLRLHLLVGEHAP